MADASRALFFIGGAFWLVIGVLTPLAMDRDIGRPALFVTEATDTELYGRPPEQILSSVPELATFRSVVLRAIAGLLVAAGLLVVGVAWFGLREPEAWALALLTLVALVVLPYWWITFGAYRTAGVSLPLTSVPPFMWVPGILMPVGAVLGWIAYLRA